MIASAIFSVLTFCKTVNKKLWSTLESQTMNLKTAKQLFEIGEDEEVKVKNVRWVFECKRRIYRQFPDDPSYQEKLVRLEKAKEFLLEYVSKMTEEEVPPN